MGAMLYVLLTTAPELPGGSRAALVSEATALWGRAGVRLEWIAGSDGRLPPGSMLRVLVLPRPQSTAKPPGRLVLGELVGSGRAGALAIVSIARAQELVTAWRRRGVVPDWVREDLIGLVLGRVVAHEIGHYVLATRAHTRSGLMRPTFEIAALMDYRSDAFDLDAEAMALLRDRPLHEAVPAGPFVQAAGSGSLVSGQ